MPSPFPGMNPYFEQTAHWLDFHTEFLVALRRLMAPQIGPKSIVRLEEDIGEVRFLEVRDRKDHGLITVIELLCPSNKRSGDGREQYLAKRRDLLRSSAHFVEIDLLRGWVPMPQKGRPESDFSVMVSSTENRPTADFWPVKLRDRLPVIPIPLRRPDAAVHVDLQEALHRAYDGPGYEHFIYAGDPEPPLSADDAAWAGQFAIANP
jgi:hypothetical protein